MKRNVVLVAVAVLTMITWPKAVSAQYTIATSDGSSSLRFGVLAQTQAEWLENATATETAQNIFVRRTRLLVGGKLGERVTLFLETDSPNVGKAGSDGKKNEGTIYLQDLILTYSAASAVKIDAGLLLLPLAYNGGQAATSLLGIDYGPHSFAASAPTNCRVGRDYGVQLRSYLANQHLELRAGAFQGVRGSEGTKPFRAFGRAAIHVLEGQTDFFYVGTTQGKRRLLDLGASYDRQGAYSTFGADIFFDHPIGGGNAVTAQADYWRVDGGSFLTDLPRQNVWFGEAGVYLAAVKVEPYVQFSRRDYVGSTGVDESFVQGGIAYFPMGHKLNVKLGAGRFKKSDGPARLQVVAQLQLLLW
jgi:hypothetical protein